MRPGPGRHQRVHLRGLDGVEQLAAGLAHTLPGAAAAGELDVVPQPPGRQAQQRDRRDGREQKERDEEPGGEREPAVCHLSFAGLRSGIQAKRLW